MVWELCVYSLGNISSLFALGLQLNMNLMFYADWSIYIQRQQKSMVVSLQFKFINNQYQI